MYTFKVNDVPLSDDPTTAVVTANLVDDSGAPTVVRSYSLPVANNPQPVDFQALMQADVDSLNVAQAVQTNLVAAFLAEDTQAITVNRDIQGVKSG